jgi:hypothetical protein
MAHLEISRKYRNDKLLLLILVSHVGYGLVSDYHSIDIETRKIENTGRPVFPIFDCVY